MQVVWMAGSKTERVQVLMTVEALKRLDNWRFAAHIASRGEAIRKLVEQGLSVAESEDRRTKVRRKAV